jgi:hypothetical protein
MRGKTLAKTVLTLFFAVSTVFIAQAARKDGITKVRDATAQFQHTQAARDTGYNLIPGLDYCFQNFPRGGMGYHYINISLLDGTLDLSHPEAIVYAPDQNGSIQLGAVAYMVPTTAWDAEHNGPPQILGQSLHLHERMEMYVLRAWIWKNNPTGMFEDWNPDVSCPAPLQWYGPLRGR